MQKISEKLIPGTNVYFSEDPWKMSPEEIAYWLKDENMEEWRKMGMPDQEAAYWLRVAG